MAQLGHNTASCARHVYQGSLKITGLLCYRFLISRKSCSCRLGFSFIGRNDESTLFFNASF